MPKIDRTGLIIVVASLLAITAIVLLLFGNQRDRELADIRIQGVSLARAISGVPYDQLVPGGQQQGVVQTLLRGAGNDKLAYVTISDPQGLTVSESAADGLIAPAAKIPNEPSAWLGDLEQTTAQHRFIEFHAPILQHGELQGFIRLGYFHPTTGPKPEQIPFIAMVALPVFLLVPFFYFLLRREIQPIKVANEEITKIMEDDNLKSVQISADGELGEFMNRFNHFVEMASSKVQALEHDKERLLTSSKLLTYRKNRVETVLETLPEAVMILDESGSVTFANQKLAAMFDVTQETILTQPLAGWCEHPDVLNLVSKFQTQNKARNFTETIRFSTEAFSARSIATKTYPLFAANSANAAIGTLIVFRDETQEALARKARTDFVSHLSHELKSPLNVLALYSESLLSDVGNSREHQIEAANVIAAEVDRLSSLITGLLNMTQIESGSITPDRSLVKLQDVVAAAFEEAKHLAADKNCTFKLDIPKEMNPVFVDKNLIRIAITNLMSNAVKYNKDDGSVTVTVEDTEDAIQIRVADSGIGISEEEEARIFEKFYRSTDERVQSIGGHGLGLALAKQIIELHHGKLLLNRDREEGAEFIINLWSETTAVKQAI
ncbi:MAG: ATP-binding protein [Gammaproteobacteria bacterium]|nr:ATP-binding protein [Gammaproteobacteria bacterium]NNL50135.1 PAS domain-containing protein [Woeseiaceae bacterium]